MPCPQEPGSSSSNNGSTLIDGCIWCFVVSVPGAGLLGWRVALWLWHLWRFPRDTAAPGMSFPPTSSLLFPRWEMWSLLGALTVVQLPSPGPALSLDREPSHRRSEIWNGAHMGWGTDCGRSTPWASVCEGGDPGTASQLLSVLMNCVSSGEGWAPLSLPLGGVDSVSRWQ